MASFWVSRLQKNFAFATLPSSPTGGRAGGPARAPGSTSGHHDVGQAHGGLDVLVEGGLDEFVVLLDDALDVTAALADVPAQAAHQADVRVRVDEYFQVQELEREEREEITAG